MRGLLNSNLQTLPRPNLPGATSLSTKSQFSFQFARFETYWASDSEETFSSFRERFEKVKRRAIVRLIERKGNQFLFNRARKDVRLLHEDNIPDDPLANASPHGRCLSSGVFWTWYLRGRGSLYLLSWLWLFCGL